MNDDVTLPRDLVQQIGEYLSHRPYREVAPYLNALADLLSKPDPEPQCASPS